MKTPSRQGVFVSYSHRDAKWLGRLKTLLKPALGNETVWDDTQIKPGALWAAEIEAAIASARVAVLLVTPAFLASDFIVSQELPRIIERQTREGLTIFWVAVEPALFEHSPLFAYQAANDPSRPLSTLAKPQQDAALLEVAKKIIAAVSVNAVATMLKNIDRFEPQLRAFVEDRPTPAAPPTHSITARQEPGRDTIVVGHETISGSDFVKLDSRSQQLIRTWQASMDDLFDRFTELEPKRFARDSDVRERARTESEGVRQDLCHNLNQIIGYLASLGKHLQDHYHHIRFVCDQKAQGQ